MVYFKLNMLQLVSAFFPGEVFHVEDLKIIKSDRIVYDAQTVPKSCSL